MMHEASKQINLRQATHWIALGINPIKSDYEKAFLKPPELFPDSLSAEDISKIQKAQAVLFYKLHQGELHGKGALIKCNIDFRDKSEIANGYAPFAYMDDPETFVDYTPTWIEVVSKDWVWENIDWNYSSLHKSSLHESKYADNGMFFYERYSEIRLKWQDISPIKVDVLPTKHETRGSKPKYDWNAFHTEIIRLANHPDGLPDTQAELIEKMRIWCIGTWGDEPSPSSIKEKISKIYQAIKQDRK